jgi:hypothetical protein
MNMLYEGLKDNATIVVVPSTALESMQLGNATGLIALTKQLQQENTMNREDTKEAKAPSESSSRPS